VKRAGSKAPPPPGPEVAENLRGTWPLFSEGNSPPFFQNPKHAITPFRPDTADLETLEGRDNLPETTPKAERDARHFRESQPPVSPDWQRAARALIAWLNERLERGHLEAFEEVTLARTWAAFSLAGATEPQVLKVAHLVSRAYHAIRESRRASHELQAAVLDCARVLHSGLPVAIRARMPLERAVIVVRKLRTEADPWAAVVDGATALLGWDDYARMHAASLLRTVIERSR
jgi:hypothetical protein